MAKSKKTFEERSKRIAAGESVAAIEPPGNSVTMYHEAMDSVIRVTLESVDDDKTRNPSHMNAQVKKLLGIITMPAMSPQLKQRQTIIEANR